MLGFWHKIFATSEKPDRLKLEFSAKSLTGVGAEAQTAFILKQSGQGTLVAEISRKAGIS